ncbi:MAG: hypothetical protein HY253_04200 [Burkholderiales bacterium]|nr:hypothetical protein [Burkholderiales bacterium]
MKKTETVEVARVRGATIVKIVTLGSVIGWALMSSLFGVAALFGVEVIKWNGAYLTGLAGLLASPFVGAFVGLVFGLLTSLFAYAGLRFYSLFRTLTVEYIPSENQVQTNIITVSESGV